MIPPDMSEQQVIQTINNIANRLALKFKFGYHELEDMKQMGTCTHVAISFNHQESTLCVFSKKDVFKVACFLALCERIYFAFPLSLLSLPYVSRFCAILDASTDDIHLRGICLPLRIIVLFHLHK